MNCWSNNGAAIGKPPNFNPNPAMEFVNCLFYTNRIFTAFIYVTVVIELTDKAYSFLLAQR